MMEPRRGKKGSGSASDFMELSGTRTGRKQSKQKRERIKKRKWNQKAASGRATPIAPGGGQLHHHRTLPWAASQTPHGPKTKPCTQKSRGLFNNKKHTAEIYLLALQCRRPKIHFVQTFLLAKDKSAKDTASFTEHQSKCQVNKLS